MIVEEVHGGGGGRGGSSDSGSSGSSSSDYSNTLSSGDGSGGGFSSRPDYYYEYIGENYSWTVSDTVPQATIDNINNRIKLTDEQREHYDIVNNLNDINSFLHNGTVGNGLFTLPTVEIPDSTYGFFDTFFEGLAESFTATTSNAITLDFMGTNFNIYPSDFNLPDNTTFNNLKNILTAFWYIKIYLFILKDMLNIRNRMQHGNFAYAIATNIKADVM